MKKVTNNAKIASFLGVDELLANEDGAFVNGPLIPVFEGKIDGINAIQAQLDEGKKEIAALTASIEKLKEEKVALETANASLTDQVSKLEAASKEYGQSNETIAAAHAKEIEAKDAVIALRDAAIKTSEETISAKNQEINDLNTKIDALQNDPGNEPVAGPQPTKNGGGAETPVLNIGVPAYDSALSPQENKKRMDEFMAKQQQMVSGM